MSAKEVDKSVPKRKSVTFSEGTTIMDANGEITEAQHTVDKTTAEKHSSGMSIASLADLQNAQMSDLSNIECEGPATPDREVDEVTELFKGLAKKKKSKKTKEAEAGEGEEAAPAADGEFDPTALKKKKKKVKKTDDFEAKLAEAGVTEGAEEKPSAEEIPEGDMEAGTGIWAHDATQPIPYQLLVTRFFSLIQSHHPDLLSSGTKSYKIPPPQCLREGNRRTIFANISEICKRMKRSDDHVMQFLFAELGTSGSVDGSRRLVIKGRFQQKQIENVLRRYIGMSIPSCTPRCSVSQRTLKC